MTDPLVKSYLNSRVPKVFVCRDAAFLQSNSKLRKAFQGNSNFSAKKAKNAASDSVGKALLASTYSINTRQSKPSVYEAVQTLM